MKGIIFTKFFEKVEQKFDYKMIDKIFTKTTLPSSGIYTVIGTYNHIEIVSLVISLSQETDILITNLIRVFRAYLFKVFRKSYYHFIKDAPDAFTFLKFIHNYSHIEVKKLYSEELPHFDIEHSEPNTLIMNYHSIRKMSDLAYSLIEACLEYLDSISQEAINDDESSVKFVIVKL